jgi:hypothetical protein
VIEILHSAFGSPGQHSEGSICRTGCSCLRRACWLWLHTAHRRLSVHTHSLTSSYSKMTSNYPSDALILIPHTTRTIIRTQEDPRPQGRWGLIRNFLSHPHPGRTLDEVYTYLGTILETRANRVAYSLGLGPHAIVEKIKSYFGQGEKRVQQLEHLRGSIPPKLGKHCCKLMKYTLPCVSSTFSHCRI